MESKSMRRLAAVALTCALGGSVLVAGAQHGARQPAPRCSISPVDAIKVATARVPGRPLWANFEFAEGKWVYAVMIVNGKSIKEVEVDPMTGKPGAIEVVTPNDEAKEVRDDLSVAIGAKAAVPEKPGK